MPAKKASATAYRQRENREDVLQRPDAAEKQRKGSADVVYAYEYCGQGGLTDMATPAGHPAGKTRLAIEAMF